MNIETSKGVHIEAWTGAQGGAVILSDDSRDFTTLKTHRPGIDPVGPWICFMLRNKAECREFADALRTAATALETR